MQSILSIYWTDNQIGIRLTIEPGQHECSGEDILLGSQERGLRTPAMKLRPRAWKLASSESPQVAMETYHSEAGM